MPRDNVIPFTPDRPPFMYRLDEKMRVMPVYDMMSMVEGGGPGSWVYQSRSEQGIISSCFLAVDTHLGLESEPKLFEIALLKQNGDVQIINRHSNMDSCLKEHHSLLSSGVRED